MSRQKWIKKIEHFEHTYILFDTFSNEAFILRAIRVTGNSRFNNNIIFSTFFLYRMISELHIIYKNITHLTQFYKI